MSESPFPFAAADDVEVPEEQSPGRKRVLVAGGLVAALVLAAGGWLFLGGSGDSAAGSITPFTPPVRKAPVAVPAPLAPQVVPAAVRERVGRNPFKPRILPPAAAAPATTASGAPAGTATGATSGTTSTAASGASATSTKSGGTAAPSTSGSPTGAPSPQPSQPPKYLSVTGVDAKANQVTFAVVDRTASDPAKAQQNVVVKPGEVFATYFKLLGYGTLLDANNQPRNCTDLQYGDNRIKLCQGESYQVG